MRGRLGYGNPEGAMLDLTVNCISTTSVKALRAGACPGLRLNERWGPCTLGSTGSHLASVENLRREWQRHCTQTEQP